MEVLAVSAALPTYHDIKGERTLTSIVREPNESGFIEIAYSGIVENETAVHEGPVYAYFAHHYDRWCEELGIDRKEWDWCHWGENIVFKCNGKLLSEENFHLGDVWQVGSEVQLRVCGSRVPCFKLAWRCGQKDSWLKKLADTGACGVYFDVVTPGIIRTGDNAKQLEKRPSEFDCATITKAAFDGSLKTRDTVNMLKDDQRLLGMLRMIFARRAMISEDVEREGRNAWNGWRQFRPSKLVNETDNIISVYLKPIDAKPLATYMPGQFLSVRLPTGDVRNWSISDWTHDLDEPEYYRISIKKAQKASNWMAKHCTLDTVLQVRSPAGQFHLDFMPMFFPQHVYISAGVGITPIFSMLKAHRSHKALSEARAIWIHVAHNGDEIPFQDEVDLLSSNMERIWCFTRPLDSELQGRDYEIRGRPDKSVFQKLLSASYDIHISSRRMTMPGTTSKFYICGPTAFEKKMRDTLTEINVPKPLIQSENFAADGGATVTDLEESTVYFTKSKVRAAWKKDAPISILELAEKAGLEPDFGCRVGVCGSCSARLMCGSVNGGMQADGNVYICRARPSEAKVEIEI